MRLLRRCPLPTLLLVLLASGPLHAEKRSGGKTKPAATKTEPTEPAPDAAKPPAGPVTGDPAQPGAGEGVEGARRHYAEGTKAFNLGEFQRAITEYKAAYNAKPDPVFLYNIAQAYRLAGDLNNSLFFYRSYLRSAPETPKRREVEERIAGLESQISQQKAVTTMPPNNPVEPGAGGTQPDPSGNTGGTATSGGGDKGGTAVTPDNGARDGGDKVAGDPIYKKWWLWTIVGVVVLGGVTAGVLAATLGQGPWETTAPIGPGAAINVMSW